MIKKAKPILEREFKDGFSSMIWHTSKSITFDRKQLEFLYLKKDIITERKSIANELDRIADNSWHVVDDIRKLAKELKE